MPRLSMPPLKSPSDAAGSPPDDARNRRTKPLAFAAGLFYPGMRVAVAVSGGADSVALLLTLMAERDRLGLVLSMAHVHHGIRGAEADDDAEFVQALAERLGLPFYLERVDTPAVSRAQSETLEEAARHLRYAWFWRLLGEGGVDAIATAHTLDDQAETVLHRLLRGAWTEGLGGIHPVLREDFRENFESQDFGSSRAFGAVRTDDPSGQILRPFLGVRRRDIEAWLVANGQRWREDSTNADLAYTRNRLRHGLLPTLAEYNPRIAEQFAQLAALARDEEDYWQAELARLLPSILLTGNAVRGGGRATSTEPGNASVAIEIERLRPLHPALRRRVVRAAGRRMGISLPFHQTEELLGLCGLGSAVDGTGRSSPPSSKAAAKALGKGLALTGEVSAQRTARELRLVRVSSAAPAGGEYELSIPGEVTAFGLRIRAAADGRALPAALVRGCRTGDRVRVRHRLGLRSVKEVLERLNIDAAGRREWPLVEWEGEIVWMRGVDVESQAAALGLTITVEPGTAEPGTAKTAEDSWTED